MAGPNDRTLPLQETPEFKKALDEAVASVAAQAARDAVAAYQQEMLKAAKEAQQAPSADGAGLRTLFDQMGLAIAEIADQGSNRKRVAPEVLAQRKEAREKLFVRLEQARERGEKPEYRLISKVYLNEQFIEPFWVGADKRPVPTEIIWSGMPNEAMRPINDPAKEIYALFRDSIGSTERVKREDARPMSVTPGGLVVKGMGAGHRREVGGDDPAFANDLQIPSHNDPSAPFIHVLGTVAKPARQNIADAKVA